METIRLRPDPVLCDVTWDTFERACILLGVDPDAMFAGQVALADIRTPPPSQAEALAALLLENADAYDVRAMAPDRMEAFLGLLVHEFFFAYRAPPPTASPTSGTSKRGGIRAFLTARSGRGVRSRSAWPLRA